MTDDVELVCQAQSSAATDNERGDQHAGEGTEQFLAPCDGGYLAWRLVVAAFVFEALLWGFPLSFGVFQNYYSQLPQFAHHPFISVIGTSASGIAYMGAPIIIPFTKRFSRLQPNMIIIGWLICISGLVAGSFASSLGALIFTQGIMYGIGFIIFYYPILNLVNEFWIARRGMVYGLLCSASGLSGAFMPFTLQALLRRYGYPTTLRAIAIGLAVLTGPLIPLLKGRLPPTERNIPVKTNWKFLKSSLFWIYTVSNIMQGLGYFFPSVYLPSYAHSIGLSTTKGALLIATLSISQIFGQFSFGYLSDRKKSLNLLVLSSTIISAAAVLALWGLARSFPLLIVFSLIYGFFGAGYVAMWARMGTAIDSEPTTAFATFGFFCMGKGIGNVLTGPISAALLRDMVNVREYGALKYQAIVLFTGCCMLLSGVSVLLDCMRPKKLQLSGS